ncbi:MAG: hypothetical protein H7A25_03540 [Leptospiraceae bacterium]|nr:hypothetical protein [Leptospiraceae bacterium]
MKDNTIDKILFALGLSIIALTIKLGTLYSKQAKAYLEIVMYVIGFISGILTILEFLRRK